MSAEHPQNKSEENPLVSPPESSSSAVTLARSAERKQQQPDDDEDHDEVKSSTASIRLDEKQIHIPSFSANPQAAIRAFRYAVKQGNSAIVDALLKNGLPIDGDTNSKSLIVAVESRNADIFFRLLTAGANIQVTERGYSLAEHIALFCTWSPAEKRRALELLEQRNIKLAHPIFQVICLESEERVDVEISTLTREQLLSIRDSNGNGAMHYLAANNRERALANMPPAMLKQLNSHSTAPLMFAVSNDHVGVAQFLIRSGAPLNAQNQYSASALLQAAARGHKEAVRLLIHNGASIDAQTKGGDTPLYAAATNGHVEVVELLLRNGASIDVQNKDSETPLHRAACGGHVEVVKLLLQKGAQIKALDGDNSTPLHRAAASGHVEVAELLLQKGAQIKARDRDGNISLHRAAAQGCVEVVELLLREGAPIDAPDKWGSTPLHWAAKKDHVEVVRLLVRNGADITKLDAKAIPLPLVELEDLRAEYHAKELAGIFCFVLSSQMNLPHVLVQMVVAYFTPYTREEFTFYHDPIQAETRALRQPLRDFDEKTIWFGWRKDEERVLARQLNQLLDRQRPSNVLTVQAQVRAFLAEHSAALGQGELAGILGKMVGVSSKEKAEIKPLSPLVAISKSAPPARKEKKEVSAVAENRVDKPTPVPAVSVALSRRLPPPSSPSGDGDVAALPSQGENGTVPPPRFSHQG